MAMTSDHWAVLVDPRVREVFFVGFGQEDRRQSMVSRLFDVRGSSIANEQVFGVGGLASSGWSSFEDNGRIAYDEAVKGWTETFTHHEFAKGFVVTRQLIDDNRYPQVLDKARALGDSAFRMREKAGANVFINAFSAATTETLDDYGTDATGPDSVGLCVTTHDTSPQNTTDLSNKGTSALSAANVSTTRRLMMEFTDFNGDNLNVMPDEILVPPELEDTALEIVRSAQDPASANNAINPQAGRFSVIVWHYLTDATDWFMMDSALRRQHLLWFDRVPVEMLDPVTDPDTLAVKFRAYARFSLGWTDWRWIYGQQVAG